MERKLLLAVVVVVLCGSAAFALDPMGPPTAGLQEGQLSVGGEYAFGEIDLEYENFPYYDTDDVETNRYYVKIGYGLSDDWEVYTRLGFADLEKDEIWGSGSPDFDGSSEFAYGVGTKRTLVSEDGVKWGILGQIAWMESDDKVGIYDVEIELYEIQVAVGPTVKITEGDSIYLYGGPFLHYLDGRYTEEYGGRAWESDVRADPQLGGYVGGLVDFGGGVFANIEGQFTDNAWLVAGGVELRF